MSLWKLARRYYDARGLPWRDWPTNRVRGDKFREEADELCDALVDLRLLRMRGERGATEALAVAHVLDEIGDVANTLAWIAHCFDATVEDCVRRKTKIDRGRGPGRNYRAGT